MRVEILLERDEHECHVEIQCDQSVEWGIVVEAAVNALHQVVGEVRS